MAHPSAWVAVGGFVAGTFDITYACMFWALKSDAPPQRILQSVASGLLGPASFEGGWQTAALGLGLHYVIALSMCAAYYRFAARFDLLRERPILFGGIYGLLLFGIMNAIVVPLSAARLGPRDPVWILLSVAVHVALIGIPCAYFASRAALNPAPAPALR